MILCRVERPDFELTVCGTPSAKWFEWLETAEVPLTASMIAWRDRMLAEEAAPSTDTEGGQ